MDPAAMRKMMEAVQRGDLSVDEALARLARMPFESLDFATIDHHRALRCGFAEVVYCHGKTPGQAAAIFARLATGGGNVLATRADADHAGAIRTACPTAEFHAAARCVTLRQKPARLSAGTIALVAAGTADGGVIEEARVTCEIMDQRVRVINDVGVAGLHRLLARLDALREARVIIAAAGMEGALPSVIGGLVSSPVIAVPTSIGYGASFGGIAPLLTMLNSCAAGVCVVNIDNGFGAGYLAAMINRLSERET